MDDLQPVWVCVHPQYTTCSNLPQAQCSQVLLSHCSALAVDPTDSSSDSPTIASVSESNFLYSLSLFRSPYCGQRSIVNASISLPLGGCNVSTASPVSLHLNCPSSHCLSFGNLTSLSAVAAVNFEGPIYAGSFTSAESSIIDDDVDNSAADAVSLRTSLWRVLSQPTTSPLGASISPNASVVGRSLLTRFNASFSQHPSQVVYRLPLTEPGAYSLLIKAACIAPLSILVGQPVNLTIEGAASHLSGNATVWAPCEYQAAFAAPRWQFVQPISLMWSPASLEVTLGYVIIEVSTDNPGVLLEAIALVPTTLAVTSGVLDGTLPVPCSDFLSADACPSERCAFDAGSGTCFDPSETYACPLFNGQPWACPDAACVYDFDYGQCLPRTDGGCQCLSPCAPSDIYPASFYLCETRAHCPCVVLTFLGRPQRACTPPLTDAFSVTSQSPYVPSGVFTRASDFLQGIDGVCNVLLPVWTSLQSRTVLAFTTTLFTASGTPFWAFVDPACLTNQTFAALSDFPSLALSGYLRAGIEANATFPGDLSADGWVQLDKGAGNGTIAIQTICASPRIWSASLINTTAVMVSVSLSFVPAKGSRLLVRYRSSLGPDTLSSLGGTIQSTSPNVTVAQLAPGLEYTFWVFVSQASCQPYDDVVALGGSTATVRLPQQLLPPAPLSVAVTARDQTTLKVLIVPPNSSDVTAFTVSYQRVPGQSNANLALQNADVWQNITVANTYSPAPLFARRDAPAEVSSITSASPCAIDAENGSFKPAAPATVAVLIHGLEVGIAYQVTAASVSALGQSSFSAPATASTHSNNPSAAPTNVQAMALTGSRAHVSWTAIPPAMQNGPVSYVVSYAPAADITARTNIDVGTALRTTINLPVPGRGYAIYVGAYTWVNGTCLPGIECLPPPMLGVKAYGPFSAPVPLVIPNLVLSAPRNVQVHALADLSAQISWQLPDPAVSTASDIAEYVVYYSVALDSNNRTLPAGPETAMTFPSSPATITGLPPSSIVQFQVAAVASFFSYRLGARSVPVVATTAQGVCLAPARLTATAAGSFGVALTWSVPDPLDCTPHAYSIGIATGNSTDYVTISIPFSFDYTAVTVDGLIPDLNYTFAVAAVSSLGTGAAAHSGPVQIGSITTATATSSAGVSAGAVAGILIGLVVALLVVACIVHRRRHADTGEIKNTRLKRNKTDYGTLRQDLQRSFVQKYPALVPKEDSARNSIAALERDWNSITLGKEIGEGSFGIVKLAHISDALGGSQVVALKPLRERHSPEQFLAFFEAAKIIHALAHEHIVRLCAINTMEEPFFLALEFADEV